MSPLPSLRNIPTGVRVPAVSEATAAPEAVPAPEVASLPEDAGAARERVPRRRRSAAAKPGTPKRRPRTATTDEKTRLEVIFQPETLRIIDRALVDRRYAGGKARISRTSTIEAIVQGAIEAGIDLHDLEDEAAITAWVRERCSRR